jgi:rhodanese-related sulfurtransferase
MLPHAFIFQQNGYNNFEKKSTENLPKDTKIVVYCSIAYRDKQKVIGCKF